MTISTLNPTKNELMTAVRALVICKSGELTEQRINSENESFDFQRLLGKIEVRIKDECDTYGRSGREDGNYVEDQYYAFTLTRFMGKCASIFDERKSWQHRIKISDIRSITLKD